MHAHGYELATGQYAMRPPTAASARFTQRKRSSQEGGRIARLSCVDSIHDHTLRRASFGQKCFVPDKGDSCLYLYCLLPLPYCTAVKMHSSFFVPFFFFGGRGIFFCVIGFIDVLDAGVQSQTKLDRAGEGAPPAARRGVRRASCAMTATS